MGYISNDIFALLSFQVEKIEKKEIKNYYLKVARPIRAS